MKTYFRDFVMDPLALTKCGELEEVIDCRQARFERTTVYSDTNDMIKACLDKVKKLLPQEKKLHVDLEDTILRLECVYYSAAYRDGMTDLMAAITLNRLGITKVECICPEEFSQQMKEG